MLDSGQTRTAFLCLLEISQQWRTHAEPYVHLARAARELGDIDLCFQYTKAATERANSSDIIADIFFQQALCEVASNNSHAALRSYRQAVRARHNFPEAWHNIGVLLDNLGLPGATAAYLATIHYAPMFAPAYVNLALAQERRGDFQLAEASFQKALSANSRYFVAAYGLACLLHRQRRFAEAIQTYEQAIQMSPGEYTKLVYNNAAVAYYESHDDVIAMQYVEYALQIDQNFAAAHNTHALILRHLNKNIEALTAAHKAVELDTQYYDGFMTLANLYYAVRVVDRAVMAYRRALELRPESTVTLCQLVYVSF